MNNKTWDLIIIGAGMAGISAAHQYEKSCLILEKARGVGGRMATRSYQDLRFDFGAQYFTARSPEFFKLVEQWKKRGWIRAWSSQFHSESSRTQTEQERWIGDGGLRKIMENWSQGLNIKTQSKVRSIIRTKEFFEMQIDESNLVRAKTILLTAPVPQSLQLLGSLISPTETDFLSRIRYQKCIQIFLLSKNRPERLKHGGLWPPDSSGIRWIADNSHKGLCEAQALSVHLNSNLSDQLWSDAETLMPSEFWKKHAESSLSWLQKNLETELEFIDLHRWRYSQPEIDASLPRFFKAASGGIFLAGDAFLGGRVEGAFLSGHEAAKRIMSIKA